jgi:hypothetical protein
MDSNPRYHGTKARDFGRLPDIADGSNNTDGNGLGAAVT